MSTMQESEHQKHSQTNQLSTEYCIAIVRQNTARQHTNEINTSIRSNSQKVGCCMLRFMIAKLDSAVASLCGMLILRSLDRWLLKSTTFAKNVKITSRYMESKWTQTNRHNVETPTTHTRERGADAFCGMRAAVAVLASSLRDTARSVQERTGNV